MPGRSNPVYPFIPDTKQAPANPKPRPPLTPPKRA